ncbi:MAG: glycosyltransferase family 2 protein [Bacteroidota bacterium]
MAKNSNPLVSVLMTSFNREKYITISIKSILDSSFKDFELIILDDGSTDNTLEIANSFAESDIRIRVYQNEKNLGDYPNRNKVASYATGKYLKYVDSDDLIYPWALELMVKMMEEHPSVGWGLCSMEANKEMIFPIELTPEKAYEYNYLGPGLFKRSPLSSIINREVFNAVGGFMPIRMAGDFEMWHRLSLQYNVLLMPQGFVWYRVHDAQEINNFHEYAQVYETLKMKYLKEAESFLGKIKVNLIKKKEIKRLLKEIVLSIFKFRFKNLLIQFNSLLFVYKNY